NRVRARANASDHAAEDLIADLHVEAELLAQLALHGLRRFLAGLDPSARQSPREVGAEGVLEQQHASIGVEHHAHGADVVAWPDAARGAPHNPAQRRPLARHPPDRAPEPAVTHSEIRRATAP